MLGCTAKNQAQIDLITCCPLLVIVCGFSVLPNQTKPDNNQKREREKRPLLNGIDFYDTKAKCCRGNEIDMRGRGDKV